MADDVATGINAQIAAAEHAAGDPIETLATSFRLLVHFATVEPARGWVLLRTMPLVGALNDDMRTAMTAQFAAALASRRLRPAPLAATPDLGVGFQIMTIRRIVTGEGEDGGEAAATIAAATETLLR